MIVKPWGRAYPVNEDFYSRVVHVDIDAGWQCSTHIHHHQHNTFIVLDGVLEVVLFPDDDAAMHYIALTKGDTFTVRAGVPHCFRSLTDVKAIEVYVALIGNGCSDTDIERLAPGKRIDV